MEKSDLMGRFDFDGAEGIAFWIGDSDTEPITKVMFDELETLKAFIEHNLPGMFGEPNEHCCKHPKCPGGSLCCCQGEPNGELIEYALDYIENGTMRPERREALRALASRANVPDTTTQLAQSLAMATTLTGSDATAIAKAALEVGGIIRNETTAAVGRVREIHSAESNGRYTWCVGCSTDEYSEDWPCRTIAALDGKE